MRSTTMRRTNRNHTAVDPAIRSDTINPGLFSGCQLTEPTVQDEPFCQASELLPRADILDSRELLAQRCRKGVSPDFPILLELLGRRSIERHAVHDDPLADGGNDMLEIEHRLWIAVRPQEPIELLVNADVANATRLHLRRPFRPNLNFGTNLC